MRATTTAGGAGGKTGNGQALQCGLIRPQRGPEHPRRAVLLIFSGFASGLFRICSSSLCTLLKLCRSFDPLWSAKAAKQAMSLHA